MRHARPAALDQPEDLSAALRAVDALTQESRGVFCRKGRAFLRVHEDSDCVFADGRDDDAFARYDVSTPAARTRCLAQALRRASI